MRERLKRAGYEAHAWTESLAATSGDLETVLRDFRQRGSARPGASSWLRSSGTWGSASTGCGGTPLYTFLFAVPQADYFARGTAALRDLARVRAEMLARGQRRAAEGRRCRPCAPNARLDQAAQRHAEDMLARGYFAHESPEGKTVRERARDAGYDWRAIGENIAEGQLTSTR